MDTYAIRDARTKITGHYRQHGTRLTFCNKPVGGRNGIFAAVNGWKLCARCVKAEARDRAAATATAEAHMDPVPAIEGTWRSEWIGATIAAGALFDLDPDREQGALFA